MPNINLVGMDFDDIKQSLKTYLESQSEFSDYNFEGSGLSVLLDVLAYNSHYNSYIANMMINEMFLDSSVKKSSAISIAKHIGYTPRSVRGSIANINITVDDVSGNPSTLTIPKYTSFVTTIDGIQRTFYTTDSHTTERSGTEYVFTNINVKEGAYKEFQYVIYDTTPNQKYEIPNENVDTTTLDVILQASATDNTAEIYSQTNDIVGLLSTSKVYFLEKNAFDKFEIYFGDNIVGKSPTYGNILLMKYIVSTGKDTNVSSKINQTFSASSVIGGSNNITVTTNSNSTGGSDLEDITSIKFYAPKFNSARNRVVTSVDYETLISSNYGDAESVSVWGGEENTPPAYGKVMVSLKPYEGFAISNAIKESIKNDILKSKQGLTIQVEFVDPVYFYVSIKCKVKYDINLTNKTSGLVKSETLTVIDNYFSTDLQKFDRDFNYSKLLENILDSNSAIKNVLISLKLQRRIIPILNSKNIFSGDTAIFFRNPIKPGKIQSSYFFINYNNEQLLVKLSDVPDSNPADVNGTGTIKMYSVKTNEIIFGNIGSVNYSTGELSINEITPVAFPTSLSDIRITADIQEVGYDLTSFKNEIFVKNDSELNRIIGTETGIDVEVVTVNDI